MQSDLEVLFTPAEFAGLSKRDLHDTVCVVFDVLRATSSMVTALGNGANAILPVAEIQEALTVRQKEPGLLLAGERDGLRITRKLSGTIDFDFGNSPREFVAEKVRDRKIVMTTTNGTRALRACLGAQAILVSSFLNLRVTADFLRTQNPAKILLVCSGTFEEAALEDVLGVGALLDLLDNLVGDRQVADSVLIARDIHGHAKPDLLKALSKSCNGHRLLSRPELKDDVAFCAQPNAFPFIVTMGKDGWVTKGTI